MAGQLFGEAGTGQTCYIQIRNVITGQIANGSGLETYNSARWTFYTNVVSEQAGSGFYMAGVPGYLPAGLYRMTMYIQLGPGPALGDTPVSGNYLDWDGGSTLGLASALNVGKINGSAAAAVNLALSANTFVIGAAAAGTLTNVQMTTDLVATVANIYAGRVLYFTSGVNAGLAVLITAYVVTGGRLTFVAYNNQPAPSAPGAGDTFVIF